MGDYVKKGREIRKKKAARAGGQNYPRMPKVVKRVRFSASFLAADGDAQPVPYVTRGTYPSHQPPQLNCGNSPRNGSILPYMLVLRICVIPMHAFWGFSQMMAKQGKAPRIGHSDSAGWRTWPFWLPILLGCWLRSTPGPVRSFCGPGTCCSHFQGVYSLHLPCTFYIQNWTLYRTSSLNN